MESFAIAQIITRGFYASKARAVRGGGGGGACVSYVATAAFPFLASWMK